MRDIYKQEYAVHRIESEEYISADPERIVDPAVRAGYPKKSLSVTKGKYVKVGSDQGTISYKITSAKKGTKNFKKSFSISKSSGKITV